jgi:hypothetical protein
VIPVGPQSGELPRPAAWRGWLRTLRGVFATRAVAVTAALIVGAVLGTVGARSVADDPMLEARRAIEATLLPLAIDADGVWTSSSDTRRSVSDAFVAFRRDRETALVEAHLDGWLASYDNYLTQLAGEHLTPAARPVQRQLIAGVTLSRDAVEVLGHAAEVQLAGGEPATVEDLLTEVGRLRQRSEQLLQAARAASGDLAGQTVDVGPLDPVLPFPGP